MDKKIDIDTLKSILRDHLEATQQAVILKDIQQALSEEETEKEKEAEDKPPKIEKKTVVILTSLPPEFPEKELENLAGFITEIAADQRTQELKKGIANVMNAYSHSKKAKKAPANSLGELFEIAPAKLFKEEGILKKPKGPLEFVFKPNR